jgi:hypothetical protein
MFRRLLEKCDAILRAQSLLIKEAKNVISESSLNSICVDSIAPQLFMTFLILCTERIVSKYYFQ